MRIESCWLCARWQILFLAATLLLFADLSSADQPSQPGTGGPSEFLSPGLRLLCDVAGGQSDFYQLVLDGNQVLRLGVDQRGIDVEVKLRDPDGDIVFTRDGSIGPVGEERLLWVIGESGRHELEISAFETEEPAGCYEISYEAQGPVEPSDQERASAARELVEALTAADPGSPVSIEKLEAVAARWESLGGPLWQAEALVKLGILHSESEPQKALSFFLQAEEKASSDPALLAFTKSRIGNLYRQKFFDLENAREHLLASLELFKTRFGARHWEARTSDHLGEVYHALGEFHQAFFYYNQAAVIWNELGNSRFKAISLHNRGWLHFYLARFDEAYEDLKTALSIEEANLSPGIEKTLTLISYVLVERGEFDQAFAYLDRAFALRQDQRGRAVTRMALAWAHYKSGNSVQALELYEQALQDFEELGEETNAAKALHKIGLINQNSGNHAQALRLFRKSLGLFRSASSYQDGEAENLLGIARSRSELGGKREALANVNEAIDIIEALRMQPFDHRLRAIFFASKQHFFDFKIELLMAMHEDDPYQGFDVMALATSERTRARSMIETLNESGVDLSRGGDRQSLEREAKIRRRIKTRLYQSWNSPESQRQIRTEILQLEQEHQRLLAEIRRTNPFYIPLTTAEPLSVEEIQQQVLDEETLLLEYYLGERKSYLWAVTPDAVRSFELDVSPKSIEETARQVYRLLPVGRQRKYRIQLEFELSRLSRRLLSDVAETLAGKKRLLVVSGGALQYVPFAAMPLPGSASASGWPDRLVSTHEIVSLSSASTLPVLRQAAIRNRQRNGGTASNSAMVLADPVFHPGDERVPGASNATRDGVDAAFARLEYSGKEAEAIRDFLPDARVAMGFDATKELATSRELGKYRYIHLATHGTFDAQFPERSGLVLSLFDRRGDPMDGTLHLPEIYHLGLAAELVVLSACQTALGEEIRGEGLVGLTQGFMYSGAPRVLASLWNVLDESTSVLMKLFYERLLEGNLSPGAALRAAQTEFLEKHPEWSEPFFWAGFILQGDF